MMLRRAVTVLGLALVVGSSLACAHQGGAAATAQGPAPTEATQEAKNEGNPDDLICEVTHVTGSNIPERVCRTRRQIEAEREDAQRFVRESAQRGYEPTKH